MQAADIKTGLDIFQLVAPPFRELVTLERELELLESVWSAVARWQEQFRAWKDGRFRDLKVGYLQSTGVWCRHQLVRSAATAGECRHCM